jgi:folate-binding protein YgfZ
MAQISALFHIAKPAAVLRVTGPDAFAFLQSQFSNDLRQPGVERPVTYGLWLDQKGKIQADSFVIQRGPAEFLVVSYDCAAEKIRAHLEAHLIADEVEVKDETGGFGLMHVHAMKAHPEPEGDGKLWDMEGDDLWKALPLPRAEEMLQWQGRRSGRRGWSKDFLADADALAAMAAKLSGEGLRHAAGETITHRRIAAGVPAVTADAGPGDLPQEAGLEREAVSFTKGCFLGQEVMARLKAQGHVNRALWMVQTKHGTNFPAGTEPLPLYAGEVVAGELRSRQFNIGLAMLKKRAIAGREGLSLTSGGEDVVSLSPAAFVRDLTLPPT